MKIGIVGSGPVGATAAYALIMRGVGREIVLIDHNADRAQAEAYDLFQAVPFANPLHIVGDNDYAKLNGCKVVIIATSVAQNPDDTQLQLLGRNAAVFRAIVPQILAHAPDTVLLVASNPVDIMTHMAAQFAAAHGVPSSRVLGLGTTLDTAHFRALLGKHLGVDSQHIHGYVVGEQGDSKVLTWSLVTVGGIPLDSFCKQRRIALDDATRKAIEQNVRTATAHIIEGKGATYYGIGSALAHIVEAILRDQHAVLTVCTPIGDVAGVASVTVALAYLVGGNGIIDSFPLPLNEDEHHALRNSTQIVRKVIDDLQAEGVLDYAIQAQELSISDLSTSEVSISDLSTSEISIGDLSTIGVSIGDLSTIDASTGDASIGENNISPDEQYEIVLHWDGKRSLSGFDLSGRNLAKATLAQADLSEADLSGANLSSANLSGADLSNANLNGANLFKANLSGAKLFKASLGGARLIGANLSESDLRKANLSEANLFRADLNEADLSKAKLYSATISDEQLAVAKSLKGTIMPDGARRK